MFNFYLKSGAINFIGINDNFNALSEKCYCKLLFYLNKQNEKKYINLYEIFVYSYICQNKYNNYVYLFLYADKFLTTCYIHLII